VSLHQQALPGWEVQVDGKVADVVEVDGIFLGVVVPAGQHDIDWRYRPTWLTWSKWVSIFGLLLTLGLAVVRWGQPPSNQGTFLMRKKERMTEFRKGRCNF
jgi:uncharacterized membrane protein YfhO